MAKIAVFPGSFDPITKGHEDLIKRALPLFDKIIVAIGVNADKKYMFTLEERKSWIRQTFKSDTKVEVGSYEGLNSVISTDPVPHMALSSAPGVPTDVSQAVKKALLEAVNTPDGKKMLEEMSLSGFNDTSAETYAGYADMLDGIFGY